MLLWIVRATDSKTIFRCVHASLWGTCRSVCLSESVPKLCQEKSKQILRKKIRQKTKRSCRSLPPYVLNAFAYGRWLDLYTYTLRTNLFEGPNFIQLLFTWQMRRNIFAPCRSAIPHTYLPMPVFASCLFPFCPAQPHIISAGLISFCLGSETLPFSRFHQDNFFCRTGHTFSFCWIFIDEVKLCYWIL